MTSIFFDEGGTTKFVPLINVNRYETIDRAVRELLTPAESVVEVVEGVIREEPALLLPGCASSYAGASPGGAARNPIPGLIEAHLVTGSERAKEKDGTLGDYVDQCANHLLLADAYSALAELEAGERVQPRPGNFVVLNGGAGSALARRREEGATL